MSAIVSPSTLSIVEETNEVEVSEKLPLPSFLSQPKVPFPDDAYKISSYPSLSISPAAMA